MKLLLDENLSRRLVSKLLDAFPGTIHVSAVDLLMTPDPASGLMQSSKASPSSLKMMTF